MNSDHHIPAGPSAASPGASVSGAPRREPILVLAERELREVVSLDLDALSAIEHAFTRLARREAEVPPILGLFVPERHGEVDVKAAYIHGLPSLAVKIASGFFDNHVLGLPSGSGLMVVLSTRTGYPQAVLLDNGYLTDVRTALAGAAAAKYLAPGRVRTVGVVGAGAQGRYQVRALQLVRAFERVLVHDQSAPAVEAYVREMPAVLEQDRVAIGLGRASGRPALRLDRFETSLRAPRATSRGEGRALHPVRVEAADPEALVRASDVVITCTPSHQPVVKAAWLHPGLHITAMGADTADKQELESGVLGRATRLACDLKTQCFARGEFFHARGDGVLDDAAVVAELGELTSERRPGRQQDDEITVCALTGVGVQDTAIALLAYTRAKASGLGTAIG